MSFNKLLKTTALSTVLLAATVMAQTPYDEGQKALREQDWTVAADQFKQAIKADKNNADASMYWRAHALYKAGRKKEAEHQVRSLERKYPDSRWVKEAQVLQIEHDESVPVLAATANESGIDEDLRMFALAQLMDRDPERALPLVLEILKTTDSESVRRDTIFMLGMSDEPLAQQAIAQIARDSKDPGLQAQAIQMLGVMGATDFLRALYPTLTDHESRVAALEAFFMAGDTETLRQVLETETDPELRKTAIRGIAMADDEDAAAVLGSIYDHANSVEEKNAVLEAMMIASDTDGLIKVLESEKNPELRASAMQMLAVSDDEDAARYLLKLYPGGSHEEKQAVIRSMMIMEDTEGLIGLLKTETDPELKRELLQTLTLMDSDASDEYLFEMLENKG